ncbi:MAG: bile acid:sodium symporter, partial [Acidimicrobiia bacterium]|nr:bile acid:sodium symporter [Acidimicrobiia bacterium]
MDAILTILNAIFVAFVVSTMFHVGLTTTIEHLAGVVRNVWLMVGALVASLVAVPLLGWGIAEVFSLDAAAYVALVLVACSPGAPFSVALNGIAKGRLVAGAALMSILAVIGSVTTPITFELIITSTDLAGAGGGEINTLELVRTILLLQFLPIALGMATRGWKPSRADAWEPTADRVSSVTFGLVALAVVVGGFQEVVDLIGSWLLPAAVVFTVAAVLAGALLSPGPRVLRHTAGIVASSRNASPV